MRVVIQYRCQPRFSVFPKLINFAYLLFLLHVIALVIVRVELQHVHCVFPCYCTFLNIIATLQSHPVLHIVLRDGLAVSQAL